MLSLDFLAGFSIFLIALIIAVSYVPGFLIGLDSTQIDYDAVAYRTGVILVEDPGEFTPPPVEEIYSWEQLNSKNYIERFGLAVSGRTPNVLSSAKIDRFFNDTFFDFNDYQEMMLFSEWTYRYNISLKTEDGDSYTTGDHVPEGTYGYIRRIVRIKDGSGIECDFGDNSWAKNFNKTKVNASQTNSTNYLPTDPESNFIISLNHTELVDLSKDDAFRIDPRTDPITITINNFNNSIGNFSDVSNVTLRGVKFRNWDMAQDQYIPYAQIQSYDYYIVNNSLRYDYQLNNTITLIDTSSTENVTQIYLHLDPTPQLNWQKNMDIVFDLAYNFTEKATGKHYFINGTQPYDYGNATTPALKNGVLEVAIW